MPKILLAPLDWGLGHATRCIPIIKELLNNKCEVIIAAKGNQKALLEAEFPHLTFHELPGYGIKYGKNRASTFFKIVASIPKILISIKRENRWLTRFCAAESPDIILSDNRYGLHMPGIHSVFITHQLRLFSSLGRRVDDLLQKLHYRAIGRFSQCWVPDLEQGGLAGSLSHPALLPPIPTRYIGILSRMKNNAVQLPAQDLASDTGDPAALLLILLSGPEPQRSILERILLPQLASYPGRIILVRGLPEKTGGIGEGANKEAFPAPAHVAVFPHLASGPLRELLLEASLVVCRAGYSSLMDLVSLGKKAILIPTPGQTEQEYLGEHLQEKGIALCVPQTGFSLQGAVDLAKGFTFAIPALTTEEDAFKAAIADLLNTVPTRP